jgi:hypothetical protein
MVQFYSIWGICKVNEYWFKPSLLREFINITNSGSRVASQDLRKAM